MSESTILASESVSLEIDTLVVDMGDSAHNPNIK